MFKRRIRVRLSRETIVNRTYGAHKNLFISLFLPTIFGPIYCDPPSYYVPNGNAD